MTRTITILLTDMEVDAAQWIGGLGAGGIRIVGGVLAIPAERVGDIKPLIDAGKVLRPHHVAPLNRILKKLDKTMKEVTHRT